MVSEDKLLKKMTPELDPFRHEEFINDLAVLFLSPEGDYSAFMWVRLRKKADEHLYEGILLNDPVNKDKINHNEYDEVLLILIDNRLLGLPLNPKYDCTGKWSLKKN